MAVQIRPAEEADLGAIHSIFAYYVKNTVVSFLINDPPRGYVKSRFNSSRARNLPYLVAELREPNGAAKVVGYTYASAFRGFMLGYGHTVEMTIFCHPDHTKVGIGGAMMKELLRRLENTKHQSHEDGHEDNEQTFEIKRVIAVMSIDDKAEGGGMALRDWYLKWGFEVMGRLSNVGFKDKRW